MILFTKKLLEKTSALSNRFLFRVLFEINFHMSENDYKSHSFYITFDAFTGIIRTVY